MENLFGQIEDLSRAKGIEPQVVIDALKDAIVVAARKYYKTGEELVGDYNSGSGQVEVFAVKIVSELVANPAREISISEAQRLRPDAQVGEQIRFQKNTEGLGRISAQLAKQVIFQKIREAERETIFNEFADRIGEIVPCTVKRIEGPDLIVDIGRTEARLPRREQSRLESFSPGDRVRVVIKNIEKAGRGPAVIVSRASEELVKTLFEQEVPEIYDGTVKIMACGREAGERTKIAVQSSDRDVDAVGACVGMKGMRVQSIIRELRGEKIDIIEYSEDPVDMASRALSPAKISRVTIIDPLARHLEVIVEETQLSLAIGKKGQNVRLAAKLMGWRIDIKSEDEKRQEVETAMAAMGGAGTPVSVLIEHNLSESLVDKLLDAGSSTIESLADMTPEQLEEIPGIGPKMVEKITQAVSDYFSQFETSSPAVEPLDLEDLAAAELETEATAPAVPKAPAVMPGLPVEGADADDEFDDEDIDFDTMDEGSSFPLDEDEDEEDEIVGADAASLKVEPPPAPVVDASTPAEDDVHDNLTAKESQQS
jgi:N utilization substance protein A